MSDETCAVPTSADIEAIHQRILHGVPITTSEADALLAALDGERRHRADLERVIEDAVRQLDTPSPWDVLRVLLRALDREDEFPERWQRLWDATAYHRARQVVQEAETQDEPGQ